MTEIIGATSFSKFWALGYKRLCPDVPPGVPLSEKSSLSKRMKKDPSKDPRGKVPGVKGRDGRWYGIDFTKIEPTFEEIQRWQAMGASVGIKLGRGLYAIDADTKNLAHAKIIHDEIVRRFGNLAVRIGDYPKALYLIRTSAEMPYMRIEFGERDENNKLKDRVEILGEDRQAVAEGIHPKTMKEYGWPGGIPAHDDIPIVDPSEIRALLETLKALLPAASDVRTEGTANGTEVPQERLRGEIDEVRRAIKSLPNTTELFPERENYLSVGYMLKAALPDDQDEAFDLFLEWAEKWEDGAEIDENGYLIAGNDPDTVRSDWDRMQPPFRMGAPLLYELATKYSAGDYQQSDRWLDEPGTSELLFPPEEGTADARLAAGEMTGPRKYKLVTIAELMTRPPPKYLIERHLPETGVGFLYGAPSTGKSFITLDMALAMAFGFLDWHGDVIHGDPKRCVIYIAGEGASGFRARVKAWMAKRSIPEDVQGRFALIEESIDFMSVDDIDALVRTLVEDTGCPVAMVVVDTVSRSIPGADENLQKDMSRFVAACTRVEKRLKCVVVGVHHAGKSGDMRGSTVLLGAGDFVFRLDRKKGDTIGKLTCEKMKDGPDAWADAYRFDLVDLDGGESSLVPTRCELSELDPAAGAGVSGDVVEAVMQSIRDAWDGGNPWSLKANTGERSYVRRMVSDLGMTAEKAAEIMAMLIGKGFVAETIFDTRKKKKGLRFMKPWSAEQTDDVWLETEDEGSEIATDVVEGSVFD